MHLCEQHTGTLRLSPLLGTGGRLQLSFQKDLLVTAGSFGRFATVNGRFLVDSPNFSAIAAVTA